MKKVYVAIGILGLFILGYVLDYVAGPVAISINSPLLFLDQTILSRYPFTTVSIAIKTVALFLSLILLFSFIEKAYLVKGTVMLFIAALFELYSIQQLATGAMMIPIQWILTLTFTGVTLLIPTVVYFIIGIISSLYDKAVKPKSEASS